MKITGIIKDAFLFPSKNTGRFAIYLLLSVLMTGFALGGILTYAFGILDGVNFLTGGVYLIIALLIGFILSGYHVKIIKSGIEHDDKVPTFKLYENFMTGFDYFVVSLVYFIIPALIVILVGYGTNLFSNASAIIEEIFWQAINVFIMGSSMNLAINAISNTIVNFVGSLVITIFIALIVFVIFSIIQSMAEARLANTGSLREALNVFEAARDIIRIGVGRVIILAILIFLIIGIIETILLAILSYYPFLISIFCIIITPYMALVVQRALGLLYSDIA